MRVRLVILMFLLPLFMEAQNNIVTQPAALEITKYLTLYNTSTGYTESSPYNVTEYITKLSTKRDSFKKDKLFLEYLFNKTHQRFLKHYEDYASFPELLERGRYNCLTGTALYALLLNHFDYQFEIIETNYHIFLIAHTSEGDVLFEATDPTKGFVDNATEIRNRINTYRENTFQQRISNKTHYKFNFDLYNTVTLDEILGLLHYNLAIEAFNEQQYASVIKHLDEATTLYQSARIEEFSRIVLLSIIESELDTHDKENYVRKIQYLRKKKLQVIASATTF